MNALRTSLTGLLLGGLLLVSASADAVQLEGAEVGKWTMDYDAAVKVAAEKKLPLLLNFTGSDLCGWCKLMDETVFAKEDWKTYAAKNLLLVTLDFPQDKTIVPEKYVERNTKLQEKFGVQGYPTYIVLDNDGETALGQLGAGRDKTPESFIQEFEGVTQLSASNIAAFKKAHPDKADALTAAMKESKDASQALSDWIDTRPEQNDENNAKYEAFKKRILGAETTLRGVFAADKKETAEETPAPTKAE